MSWIERAGARLHYTTRGDPSGPAVILQHPLCSDPECFDETTLPERLLEAGYHLVLPASLAHGASSAPVEGARYALSERALDVVAVLDALEIERAAYVGYSMGTWIGCGLLAWHPERLVGASLGGFDPMRGSNTCGIPRGVVDASIGRGMLALYARWEESRLVPGVSDLGALQRCFSALYDPMPSLDQIAAAGLPIALWCARFDLYWPHMEAAAAHLGVPLHTFPGHHFTASSDERLVPITLALIERAWASHEGLGDLGVR